VTSTADAADLGAASSRACGVADDILFPSAQATDVAPLVPRSNLEALRDARLFGLQVPIEFPGGLGADHEGARRVFEAIAGGCGATAFVWAQHHGAVRRLSGGDGPARETWLPRLADGSALGGIGFAYLRRRGPAAVRATRAGEGWRIDGHAPWITGWGLADVFVIMARTDDGSIVSVAVDHPYDRPQLVPGPPQRLAAMGATGTVTLGFDGLVTGMDDLVGVQTDEAWSLRDRVGSAMPAAAPLGIADRSIRLLSERLGGDDVIDALEAELELRRAAADEASRELQRDMTDDPERLADAIAAGAVERDEGLALARHATDALVAASGGGAMDLAHPAQRLSREATFYLIQAQTGQLRAATLARVAGRART
jgi:alkylation response protein AidB-like acyl-CoA dehydrogenase